MNNLTVLIFITLLIKVYGLQVKKLDAGVFVDNIGIVRNIRGMFWLDVNLNTSSINIDFLEMYREIVTTECEKDLLSKLAERGLKFKCEQFKTLWSKKEEQFMFIYNNMFNNNLEVHKLRKRRETELEVNWFGKYIGGKVGDYIYRPLFGVMSSSDREFQSNFNDKVLVNMIDVYNKLNENIDFTKEARSTLNNHTDAINNLSTTLRNTVYTQERFQIISSMIDVANGLYSIQFRKLKILDEIVTDLQRGFLNPKLIKDSDLLEEIKNKLQLDDNEELYTIDYNNIVSLKKFSAEWQNKTLHIIIPIPIIDKGTYAIKKIHNVPQIHENVVMMTETTSDYLIVSNDNSHYATVSKNFLRDSDKCIRVKKQFYCEDITVYQTEKESCIKNILTKGDPSLCNLKAVVISDALVVWLQTNTYILTVPKKTEATMVYANFTVKKLVIENSTLISENENSVLLISTSMLTFHQKNRGNISVETNFLPLNINFKEMMKDAIDISRNIQLKKFTELKYLKNDELISMMSDITIARNDLIEFRRTINNEVIDWKLIITICVAIIIFAICIKYFFKRIDWKYIIVIFVAFIILIVIIYDKFLKTPFYNFM